MKKAKIPNIIILAILTTITTVFWVAFNVYRNFTIKPPYSIPADVMEPLNPTLNKDAISKIEGRIYFNPADIAMPTGAPVPVSVTPSVSLPTPVSSPAATIQPAGENTQ